MMQLQEYLPHRSYTSTIIKIYHLPSDDKQTLTTYVIHLHNNKTYYLPSDDRQMGPNNYDPIFITLNVNSQLGVSSAFIHAMTKFR